jgi:hypothetical protein
MNPTYEKKANIKEVESGAQDGLHIDVEAPPPPYERAEGATSSTFSNVVYDAKSVDTKIDKSSFNQNSIPKQIEPSVQPIYNNHLHNYQQQEYFQQQGETTVVNIESDDNYKLPRDQQCQHLNKKRTCLENYWKSVINPVSWSCAFYFLFISPVIALFSSIWCATLFVHAVISLIIPPIGFFLCIGTAWSFRALGRLELITIAAMCARKHKPTRMYPPVFRTSPQAQTNGILQYGIKICLDKYTGMCFVYFVFVNFLYSAFAWCLVLALFVLAFSPLMIVAMPLMCSVCLKLGMWKLKMSENILI